MPRRSFAQQVKQSSPLLMVNPCPGDPGTSLLAILFIYPSSTLSLGLGIEESKHFGAMDLPG
jgi:hypothetical protein